jgi:hypothetical protein
LRFVDRSDLAAFFAGFFPSIGRSISFWRRGLAGLVSLRGGIARDALLQRVHEVHNVLALRPGLCANSPAASFGVNEFGQGLFVMVFELLRVKVGRCAFPLLPVRSLCFRPRPIPSDTAREARDTAKQIINGILASAKPIKQH